MTFLRYVPQRERAEKENKRLSEHLLSSGLVAKTGTAGYVRKALDWAPFPDDPLRVHFSEKEIRANLEEIVSGQ